MCSALLEWLLHAISRHLPALTAAFRGALRGAVLQPRGPRTGLRGDERAARTLEPGARRRGRLPRAHRARGILLQNVLGSSCSMQAFRGYFVVYFSAF